jgi:hypothetical protein
MPDESQAGPSSTHTTTPIHDSRGNKRNRTRKKKQALPFTAGPSSNPAFQTGDGSASGLADGGSDGPSSTGGMRGSVWSTDPNRVSRLQSAEAPGALSMDSSITSAQSCVSSGSRGTKRRRTERQDEQVKERDDEVHGETQEITNSTANNIKIEDRNELGEVKGEGNSQRGKGKSRSLENTNRSSRYFGKPLSQAPSSEPSSNKDSTITDPVISTDLAAYRSAQRLKETELLANREREQAAQLLKEEEEKEKTKMKGELKLARGEIAFKNSVSGQVIAVRCQNGC